MSSSSSSSSSEDDAGHTPTGERVVLFCSVLQAEMQQVRSQRGLNEEGYSVAPPGSAGTALTSSPARTLWAASSPDSKSVN